MLNSSRSHLIIAYLFIESAVDIAANGVATRSDATRSPGAMASESNMQEMSPLS